MLKKIFFVLSSFFSLFIYNSVLAEDFYNYGLSNTNLGAKSLFGQADIPTIISNVIQSF